MAGNLHAVLVHESRECVVDLVRNLHGLDPESTILLYNGGTDPDLLAGNSFWERQGAIVHPSPRPMKWGWLHDFAIDCMRFGLEHAPFETMTIVDSDQLALRAGYSAFISSWLSARSNVGMLASGPAPLEGRRIPAPTVQAFREFKLWRPFLRRFEGGESKFVHWTFWPSTVFTADAAKALLELWPDPTLQALLKRTKIWASEEVILPTLVALLGLSVLVSPCRSDCVRYRVRYTPEDLTRALASEDSFWVHPIAREYDDPLRVQLRHALVDVPSAVPPLVREIRSLEGWLTDDEASLLVDTVERALASDVANAVVEVGSYCGKATVALGRAALAVDARARLCAIDVHDGVVGARDGRLERTGPTRHKLEANLARFGLAERVELHSARADEVAWNVPIQLLLIDGLHDYASVAQDFGHFANWVTDGGYVAFHDYADYFPGVQRFVDELLAGDGWVRDRSAGSLLIVRRRLAAQSAAE